MGFASLSMGWCRSASERSESSSGIGQSMCRSGSRGSRTCTSSSAPGSSARSPSTCTRYRPPTPGSCCPRHEHVDRLRRIQYGRVHLAEALARTQVHPRAEHAASRDGDVFVPRFRVDASRHALLRVVADVVLHRAEIRQAQIRLLRALPVLLEPAAVVAMHRQVEHDQARDVRLLGPQIFFEIHVIHPFHWPCCL